MCAPSNRVSIYPADRMLREADNSLPPGNRRASRTPTSASPTRGVRRPALSPARSWAVASPVPRQAAGQRPRRRSAPAPGHPARRPHLPMLPPPPPLLQAPAGRCERSPRCSVWPMPPPPPLPPPPHAAAAVAPAGRARSHWRARRAGGRPVRCC